MHSQLVKYDNEQALDECLQQLQHYPSLVSIKEIKTLKKRVKQATLGGRFIVQGGDCVEMFYDCNENVINNKLQSAVLVKSLFEVLTKKPVTFIGRIAGQYTKPRSSLFQTINGEEMHSYRGDLINSADSCVEKRKPDPKRLLAGAHHAAMTLNYMRTTLASSEQSFSLDLFPWVKELTHELELDAEAIQQNYAQGRKQSLIDQDEFELFTSHEALNLHYEQGFDKEGKDGLKYNCSAHMLWIGARTLTQDNPLVHYLSQIENTIGLKVGPDIDPEDLIKIINTLNPNRDLGKLVLIGRFGVSEYQSRLPKILAALNEADIKICWLSDPMHGNTFTTTQGIKTRCFNTMLSESSGMATLLDQHQNHLGGLHLEFTGCAVTECINGHFVVSEQDLHKNYSSAIDPRLNQQQFVEFILRMAKHIQSFEAFDYCEDQFAQELFTSYRQDIDDIDDHLINLLAKRRKLSRAVGELKSALNINIFDPKREKQILVELIEKGQAKGFNQQWLERLFLEIFQDSRAIQSAVPGSLKTVG